MMATRLTLLAGLCRCGAAPKAATHTAAGQFPTHSANPFLCSPDVSNQYVSITLPPSGGLSFRVQTGAWVRLRTDGCDVGFRSFFSLGLCGTEITRSFEAVHPRSGICLPRNRETDARADMVTVQCVARGYLEDMFMAQVGCEFEGLVAADQVNPAAWLPASARPDRGWHAGVQVSDLRQMAALTCSLW